MLPRLSGRSLKSILVGSPFPSSHALHERLDKKRALAVFASDPISSNAYATEAIMVILVTTPALGIGHLWLTFPIAVAIAALVVMVIFSYNQTIRHYPQGGGAYIVAKDNLGTAPSLLAGAALLTDYILTVAVSVTAGIRAVTSAVGQDSFVHEHRVIAGIVVIALITWVNLRGARESGTIFALPTYVFVGSVLLMLGWGIARFAGLPGFAALPHPNVAPAGPVGISSLLYTLFVLRAFAAGCTALTGIEAISDGVQAFKPPEAHNAVHTMRVMGAMAMGLFLGISFLATQLMIVPSEESVLSQLARLVTGGGPLYYVIQVATMFILFLAANTAYQDFPRLASFMARDRFMPRWMMNIGGRLVFSSGILTLAVAASLLVAAFGGSEIRLLPLYAIGVFISFTVSQAGMVRLWDKVGRLKPGESVKTESTVLHYEDGWRWRRTVSLVTAIVCGMVLVILAATKFSEGAWLVLIAIPGFVWLFRRIHHHYLHVVQHLRLRGLAPEDIRDVANVVIVPAADIHRGSLRAIKYALRIADDVRVVYVALDEAAANRVQERWERWSGVTGSARLVVIHSPYREVLGPLEEYIERVNWEEFPNELVTVVIPEFVPEGFLSHLLHNQTATLLRLRLHDNRDVVVIDVPYHLSHDVEPRQSGGTPDRGPPAK
jgi:amino acid transporter